MKTPITIKVVIIVLCLTPLVCLAEENTGKPLIAKPFMKLGRGMINTISSPLELPNQMYLLSNHAYENSPYGLATASAAIEGCLMGVVYTFWRLGAGTYDLLTFPLPKYEFCPITPIYLTSSYKKYYRKERASQEKIEERE